MHSFQNDGQDGQGNRKNATLECCYWFLYRKQTVDPTFCGCVVLNMYTELSISQWIRFY